MKSYQLCGDYFINHEMRIPSFNNQDSMESKSFIFRNSNEGFQIVTSSSFPIVGWWLKG